MHFHVPDPAFTASAANRAHFRLAVKLAAGFVALVWLVYLMNAGLDLDPDPFGIRPREWRGLPGILLAPLVHGGFEHLIANTPPLLVLGTAMLFLYPNASPKVLPWVYLGPGIAVWLFGRGSVHLGASGLVYGLASYVFFAGMLRRDRRAIAASLVVAFMYGTLVWGVFPIRLQMSWETHLAAALIGTAMALALRRLDVPPRKRYTWEDEAEHDESDPPPDDGMNRTLH